MRQIKARWDTMEFSAIVTEKEGSDAPSYAIAIQIRGVMATVYLTVKNPSTQRVLRSLEKRMPAFTSEEKIAIHNFLNEVFYGSNDSFDKYDIFEIKDLNLEAINPVTQEVSSFYSIITELNDHHKWTREQIADWLDTLDNQPRFV